MKKLIVISLLLLAVVGVGIAESAWSARHYSEICLSLDRAYEALLRTEEGEVCAEAEEILAEVAEDRSDMLVLLVVNTNASEKVCEYAAQGLAYAGAGQNADARSAVLGAKRAAERLKNEALPLPRNVL